MPKTQIPAREIVSAGLDVLTADRLSELAIGLGTDPTGKSDAIARKLARHPRLNQERLLDFMTVFELGDLCRELGLESHGRSSDALRGRILGVDVYRSNAPRVEIESAIPEALQRVAREKQRRFLKVRAVILTRRAVSLILWSASAAGLMYFLVGFLSRDGEVRTQYAAISFAACAIVKARRMGRFGGIFFYGVAMVASTFAGYSNGWLDLEMASQSRLALVWSCSVVAGAIIGIGEEIGGDMR